MIQAAIETEPAKQGKHAGGEAPTDEPNREDPRFRELMALAQNGDENALGDLWREFGFDFEGRGPRQDGGGQKSVVSSQHSEARTDADRSGAA